VEALIAVVRWFSRRQPLLPHSGQILGRMRLSTPRTGGGTLAPGAGMTNEFTAVVEQDGPWFIAYSPEIPGANGQGQTKDEALQSLAEAIALVLRDRREDGLRGLPPAGGT
jgi:predicted RNase H-like HicB family nuclease